MEQVLFNLNDLALLLVIAGSGLLLVLLLTGTRGQENVNRLLAALLGTFAVDAAALLLYWCKPLKSLFPEFALHSFLWLQFAVLLQGPLLYLYVRCYLFPARPVERRALLHMLPALAAPLVIGWLYLHLHETGLARAVWHFEVLGDQNAFNALQWLQRLSVLCYGLLSLTLFRQFIADLQNNYSSLEKVDQNWLKIMVSGFLLIGVCRFAVGGVSALGFAGWDHWLSVTGNYLDFIFVNALVFYSLQNSAVMVPHRAIGTCGRETQAEISAEPVAVIPAADADQLEAAAREELQLIEMRVVAEQAYLNPEITLDQLAEQLALAPRHLSTLLNRHRQQNFFEFINQFRVERAQQLLREQPDWSVQKVMEHAGFNSKSAFNRFFKKLTGSTPSEFRRAQRGRLSRE